jgi:outer membrane protein OmpA-like peptidoglycan-associated protein
VHREPDALIYKHAVTFTLNHKEELEMSPMIKPPAGIPWLVLLLWLTGSISALAEEKPSADAYREKLLPPKKIITMGVSPASRSAAREKPIELDILIPFELNQHLISSSAVPYLKALGEALSDEDLRGYVFEIQGHTCDLGSDAFNLTLSDKRAATVKDYLVTHYPISPDQIKTEGFGKKNPKADNRTEEGRTQNRRVTVVNTLQPFNHR